MAMDDKLTINITGHGEKQTTAAGMDVAIQRYLPGSPYTLRQKIDAHLANGFGPGHYDRLITVTEYLMVLADLDRRAKEN